MTIWGCQLDRPGKRKLQGFASTGLEGHFPDCWLMEEGTGRCGSTTTGQAVVGCTAKQVREPREASQKARLLLPSSLSFLDADCKLLVKNALSSHKLSWATVFITSTETKGYKLQHYTGIAQSSFHERLIRTQGSDKS